MIVRSDFVFRHAGGCLFETPDLCTPPGARRCWVATLWHDPSVGSIARLMWQPGERGWQLPVTLAVGDVIEFGAVIEGNDGQRLSASACWYGWLDHATDRALILHGPFQHAAAALDDARPLVDEIRLAQLTALSTDATAATGGATRA